MSNPTCLSIVEGAYRATLEEQDDAALWFNAAVRNSGSDTNVLLKDLAVHYALAGQTAPTLNVGDVTVDNPPAYDDDLSRIIAKGGKVYVVDDDLAELGLAGKALIAGVDRISRADLPRVTAAYDHLWWW